MLQLLDEDGTVVLETPFSNPGSSTTTATRLTIGNLTASVNRLLLRIDTNVAAPTVEYVGGFAGLWVNGVKIVPGTFSQTILTFPGDVSTNPDLQYFLPDDVVGGTVFPATNYSQYSDRYAIEPAIVGRGFNGITDSGVNYANDGIGYSKVVSVVSIPDLPAGAPVKVYGAWSNSSTGGSGSTNAIMPVADVYFKINDDAPFQPQSTAGSIYPVIDSEVLGDGTFTIEIVTNYGGGAEGWNYSGFYAIEVDGIVLTDNTEQGIGVKVVSTDLTSNLMIVDGGDWDPNDIVEYQTNGGEGSIISVSTADNSMSISDTGDRDNRWIAENKANTNFYVAPKSAITVTTDKAYGKLSIVNDQALVTSIQQDDPGYLPIPSKDYTIKFPAVFPTGNTPDVDLPAGCDLTVTVKAENTLGLSEKDSNTVLPISSGVEGAAGYITASDDTTVTVDAPTNLDIFNVGDTLVMVDEEGDLASYNLITTNIQSVEDQTGYIQWLSDDSTEGWTTSTSEDSPIGPNGSTEAGFLYGTSRAGDKLVFYFSSIGVTINKDTEVQFNCVDAGGAGWTPTTTTVYTDAGDATMSGGTADPLTNNRDGNVVTIPAGATYMALDPTVNSAAGQQNFGGLIVGGVSYNLYVNSSNPGVVLTFPGDVSTNPDLQYFLPGDVVQTSSTGGVGRPYKGYTENSDGVSPPDITTTNYVTDEVFGVKPTVDILNCFFLLYDCLTPTTNPVFDQYGGNSVSWRVWGSTDGKDWTLTNDIANSSQITATGSYRYWAIYRTDTTGIMNYANFGFSNSYIPLEIKVVSTNTINNTMTVDGGEWSDGSSEAGTNQSQDWTDQTSLNAGASYLANKGPESIFNNDQADYNYCTVNGYPGTSVITVNFDPPLSGELIVMGDVKLATGPINQSVKVVGGAGAGDYADVMSTATAENVVATVTDCTSIEVSQSLAQAAAGVPTSVSQVMLKGIKIGGNQLVDPAGPTKVTYGPVSGEGIFASTNGTDTITFSSTNARWINDVNRLGEKYYVKQSVTRLSADNPRSVAQQQAVAAAFAAFPQNVNDRRTTIAASFYRLMAGEAISTAEFELLEDTVTTAVNATEPFTLDGYYPLFYTAAKANAASDLGTHHTHTINGDEFYMPDGGTLYHGTYVLPE